MPIREAFKLALQSLWANKLRTVLTLISVIVGIAAVIMVVMLTEGAKRFVTAKIDTYGASVITIRRMPEVLNTIDEFIEFQKRKFITYDDYRAVLSNCRSCVSVGAERTVETGKVVRGTRSATDTEVRGWTWTMPAISNLNIAVGRSFTEMEDTHSTHVAIVGSDIADNVLGPGDPIGKEIRVDGAPYTVIGVGESQGKMFGRSMDNWVAIPITTFLEAYGSYFSLRIYVDAGGGGAVVESVMEELRTIMRTRRHLAPNVPDAFTIESSATFQNLLANILNNFGAVVVAIAAVALVIGGIVIMNIMLVSVTERTREIGVRKALGARRRDILLQFLIESALIALAGGVMGVVAGILLANLITLAIGFPSVLVFWVILVALFAATSVGLFFGIYPAHKASELDPIAALRAEL
jgi:putative ABC transport system permease protein